MKNKSFLTTQIFNAALTINLALTDFNNSKENKKTKFCINTKTIAVFVLFTLFQLYTSNGYAQKNDISFELKGVSMTDVLNKIESQTNFKFIYKDKIILEKQKINFKAKNESIVSILDKLFIDSAVQYQIIGNQIVLNSKEKSNPSKENSSALPIKENKQNLVVKGTVKDVNGETLPVATVLEEGTTNGTATDFDGNYSILVQSKDSKLVFSYIGFVTQEIAVNNRNVIDVVLLEDLAALDEIVLVGYGTQKKNDLTGSVVSISSKDFQKVPVTNVEDLIANKLPGVQITPSSGKPGAGSSILIRGGSSLSASNNPLIVIDGVPMEGYGGGPGILSQLNPNDIESFTVLKDASAAAIYGSRASNGVVIITTKKGSLDKFEVAISSNFRVSSIIRKADVLSADQYRAVVNGIGTSRTPMGNASTDWQDEIFQKAITQEHNISLSGAYKSLPYRFSMGFLDQDGILRTGNFKRVTALFNLSPKFFDNHLKVNLNLKGSFEDEQIANQNAIWTATAFDPTQPVRVEDQTYGGYFQYIQYADNPAIALINPVSMLEQAKRVNQNKRSIGNLQLDYSTHFLPDLHLNVNAGYDISTAVNRDAVQPNYFPSDLSGGYIYYGNPSREVKNLLLESYLFYSKEIPTIKSNFDITAGYSYNDFLTTNFSYPTYRADNGTVFPNSFPPFPFDKPSNAIVSFYGRLNYSFNNKYLLTASLRRDGSSRFSEENRWGTFPSVALAWKMKDENFFKNVKSLSNLKMRLSYGVTGQQDGIANYYYQIGYNSGFLSNQYTIGSTPYTTVTPQVYNPDLRWEQTASFNVGLDYGFMDDRITGSIDFYKKDTKDLLNTTTIPLGVNFGNQMLLNIGTMENKGVEFNVNVIPVKTEDLTWNLNFNATYNENKITKLKNGNNDGVGLFSDATLVNTVGFPRNTFYLYHQVYNENGMPIEGQMLDVNNDGVINASDRYITNKSTLPKYLLGFSTSLQYKKWSFSTAFHANLGHYMFFQPYNSTVAITDFQVSQNLNTLYYDTLFRFNDNAQRFSDFYLQDASFLKMDNFNVGYNFGKTFFDSKVALGLNLTVQNVFVITKYGGIDPEAINGYDNGYPIPRVFALGMNLNF